MAKDTEDKSWTRRPDIEQEFVRRAVDVWHKHLERARIAVLMRPECPTKQGRTAWGQLRKATPAERALIDRAAPPDYVVILGLDVWSKLPDKTRLALIDHELAHASGYDFENETWTVCGHNIEEFDAVVRRHGAWREELVHFIETCKLVELPQMTLDGVLREQGADAAADRAIADAVERLRPTPGSGIDSVTLSARGVGGARLHADGRTERVEPE